MGLDSILNKIRKRSKTRELISVNTKSKNKKLDYSVLAYPPIIGIVTPEKIAEMIKSIEDSHQQSIEKYNKYVKASKPNSYISIKAKIDFYTLLLKQGLENGDYYTIGNSFAKFTELLQNEKFKKISHCYEPLMATITNVGIYLLTHQIIPKAKLEYIHIISKIKGESPEILLKEIQIKLIPLYKEKVTTKIARFLEAYSQISQNKGSGN